MAGAKGKITARTTPPVKKADSGKSKPKKSKTQPKGDAMPEKKVHRKKVNPADPSLETFIGRVLKQVHPDTSITSQASSIVEELLHHITSRVIDVIRIIKIHDPSHTKTYTSRDIQTAIRIVFTGELGNHAVSEGTKAVTSYNNTKSGTKGNAKTQSSRAGLQFPVARIKTALKARGADRVSKGAPVYLAAALEYLCAEILELSGNAAREDKRIRIKPRHLIRVIYNDYEFDAMFKGCLIAGGVLPNIDQRLLPKRKNEE